MSEYHKINTIFKRDMRSPRKTLIEGDWSQPEFEYLASNRWLFTEKVDGTNIRLIVNGDGSVQIGGRTDKANIPAPLANALNTWISGHQEALKATFPDGGVVLYGEGYGAGIQSGGTYRPTQGFVLFDIRVGVWWLKRIDVEGIATALGLDVVPICGSGTLHDAIALVKGPFRSAWGDFRAEGIVARPAVELKSRSGERIIAKIKCRDFDAAK